MSLEKSSLLAALREMAQLLALGGANVFRIHAIENGANALEEIEGEPEVWIRSGDLGKVKGIGKTIEGFVREWVAKGRIAELEQLREQTPPGVIEMLAVPGLGPKKVRQIWEETGIETLDALEEAAAAGRLDSLTGFGARTSARIVDGVAQRRRFAERRRLDDAMCGAEAIAEYLKRETRPEDLAIAGSLRRGLETVRDAGLLAAAGETAPLMEAFVSMPGVEHIDARGTAKSSVMLEGGVPVDLRVCDPASFATALLYFTGSREHNIQLAERAKNLGLHLDEHGLYRWDGADGEFDREKAETLDAPDEETIYERLGLAWITPELREGLGEIEAAERDELPRLIEWRDMLGVLHCHTTASDGQDTLRGMAEAVRDAGYAYFCVCDHSRSAAYAGGLSPGALYAQALEIDELNRELAPFRIFKGVESDILANGALDYDDATLAELDCVVVSIHNRFGMGREAMTERICRALEHPAARILAHPSGRLLLERDPYEVDWEPIFETAARYGVAIEINANPCRLDLDWRLIREAKAAGCRFAINPDAHAIEGIANLRWGVLAARKGWLETIDVVNCLEAEAFERWAKREE